MLREHCILAGIKLEEFDKVISSGLVKEEVLNPELDAVLKIWRLHELAAWEYIKLTQAYYLEEWRLLESARKELRKAWRRVYTTFVAETKALKAREAGRKHSDSGKESKG